MNDEIVFAQCPVHGLFEDYAVAVAQHGGWCPTCDGPANQAAAPSAPYTESDE